MLTGVIKGALLCCEEDIYTWNYTIDTDEDTTSSPASPLWILYKIIIPVILGFGIFGNAVILIVLFGPMFRGIAYLYLSGIALAHVGVLVSWIPICFRLGYGMRNDYPSVFYHAHLELVAVNTFSTASTLIMTCLIVDRYIFVFFPARIRSGNIRKNVKSFILSSFIFGFSVSAPLAAMRVVHEYQDSVGQYFTLRENTSVTRNGLWNTYIWTMEIAVRICPTIIFILLNSLVIKRFLKLNAKKKKFQSVSQKFRTTNADVSLLNRNRGYREEQHLAILTTVMVLWFFVTMIPSLLLSILYQNYRTWKIDYPLFRTLSRVVELCNFSLDIFIYLFCSKEFREELFKLVRTSYGTITRRENVMKMQIQNLNSRLAKTTTSVDTGRPSG